MLLFIETEFYIVKQRGCMLDKGVQTINRALDIIEILSMEKEGLGVTEIGKKAGLHKSTAHRMLNTLAERGYIDKEPKYGNYRLGMKFVEVSSIYLNKIELKTEAQPYLRKLVETVGQPAHLGILDRFDVIYIEKIEALSSIRLYSKIGSRIPVYCSALGKALLSGLGNGDLAKLIDEIEYYPYTKNTIRTKGELMKTVESVKKRGFAVDNEEHDEGVRCLAAPIRDYTGKVIASVSTAGDKRIICEERDEEIGRYVIETAEAISERLGYIRG